MPQQFTRYDHDGLASSPQSLDDYIRTVIARSRAMRERNPHWYSMNPPTTQATINPTQQETPMTTKYEAIVTFHVRYDIAGSDVYSANDFLNRVCEVMRQSIYGVTANPTISVGSDEIAAIANGTQSGSSSTGRVTWAQVQDSGMSVASESRHNPNVVLAGYIASVDNIARSINSDYRAIDKTDNPEMFERARHLSVDANPTDNRTVLPTVPASTARVIARRALRELRTVPMVQLRRECQNSMFTILDGLYEDGLPLNYELTNEEVDPF
jgi:hypothetical protein